MATPSGQKNLRSIGKDSIEPSSGKGKALADIDENTQLSSDKKTRNSDKLKEQLCRPEVWIFLIIAIVVLIICFYVAYDNKEWYSDLKKFSWTENLWVWGVILVLVLLVAGYCSFVSYIMGSQSMKMAILITFVAAMLGLLAWFWVFYKTKSLENAFYVSLILLFIAFLQIYLVWTVNPNAGYGLLPWALFSIFLVGITWSLDSQNTI